MYFVTYFDRNYLAKGLTMLASLGRHAPGRATVFVVCMDEVTRVLLTALRLPGVVTVPVHEVEEGDAALLSCRDDRSAVEYLWTCTPSVVLKILDRVPRGEVLTYVDADMFFTADPAVVLAELGAGSVLIHPHRFSRGLEGLERYGTYNVGLLAFRRDERGRAVLRWWRERCIEWCFDRWEEGKYGDQAYLNGWPADFPGVVVTADEGIGVAPWNHASYAFTSEGGEIFAGDARLVLYHFHSLTFLSPDVVVPASHENYPVPADVVTRCVVPYLAALDASSARLGGVLAGCAGRALRPDFPLSPAHSFLVRDSVVPSLDRSGVPHRAVPLPGGWTLFAGGQTGEVGGEARGAAS